MADIRLFSDATAHSVLNQLSLGSDDDGMLSCKLDSMIYSKVYSRRRGDGITARESTIKRISGDERACVM